MKNYKAIRFFNEEMNRRMVENLNQKKTESPFRKPVEEKPGLSVKKVMRFFNGIKP